MPDYSLPSLSVTVSVSGNDQETPVDDTIRTTMESGDLQTRPRFTRRRKQFNTLTYNVLTSAEKVLLDAHDALVGGSIIFPWTHPVSGAVYNVRYLKRYVFTLIGPSTYSAQFSLEEA